MPRDDKPKKLTEDLPLGERLGWNIILGVAPPGPRRHGIRHLERRRRPVRKTRAERHHEWETEQAARARRSESEWTPDSYSLYEGSGSDFNARGVGYPGADERQVESRGPPRNGDESEVVLGTHAPSRSSRPPGFTPEPYQKPMENYLHRARRLDRGNQEEGRGGPSRTVQASQAPNPFDYLDPPVPKMASMTAGRERIYRWSRKVDGVPEVQPVAKDDGASVSTLWPDSDEVEPGESISMVGGAVEDQGLYRRGQITHSSREDATLSESTRWT
ncbi:hypothetical protein N0V84_010856 [Fusarium piperis]|uniref:Uncharacterized protein n=1 Tax=Fusarium piperis TaxID=1435070 RepID=A0A9W8TBH5_9HYPO|nr:hypothetical protein N0V84_010856 [Fusarium piperis]